MELVKEATAALANELLHLPSLVQAPRPSREEWERKLGHHQRVAFRNPLERAPVMPPNMYSHRAGSYLVSLFCVPLFRHDSNFQPGWLCYVDHLTLDPSRKGHGPRDMEKMWQKFEKCAREAMEGVGARKGEKAFRDRNIDRDRPRFTLNRAFTEEEMEFFRERQRERQAR